VLEQVLERLDQPDRTPWLRGTEMRKQYDFSKAQRVGGLAIPKGKTRITIRLDDRVLDWFKEQVDAAGGGNYQSLINSALTDFIKSSEEPIERTLR
jgi:uncharacterized protein (DUF4415 family)